MHRGGFGGERSFGRGGGFDQKIAPVKIGEEVEVTVEAVGAKGDGIAKKDGFVIFVPNTRQGDTVKIRITKVLANMAFAEVAGEAAGGSQKPGKKDSYSEESGSYEERPQAVEQPVDTEDFGEEQ